MSNYYNWRWALERYMTDGWIEINRFPNRRAARNEVKRVKQLPLVLSVKEYPFRVRDIKTNRINP